MMIVRDYFVENYANCPFYDEIMLQRQRQKIVDLHRITDKF